MNIIKTSKQMATFAVTVAISLGSTALAQTAQSLTGAAQPVFYAAPPAGFDPLLATDAELAQYGIPPRPDQTEPALYAHWQKVVTAPQTRITNLTVQTTNVINGVIKNRHDQQAVNNTVSTSSDNWSGFAVTAANGTFKVNDSFVEAEWVIPAAGVDNCSYGPYASSQWVGFDGFGSTDVLQAGTAVTACSTSFVAWYEWFRSGCTSSSASYPCYQTNFSLPVSPGQTIFTEVWYTTSAPQGHAYIYNYSTQQAASVGFYEPAGSASSAYVGDSAEWVVERPGYVGSGLADLQNYVADPMTFAYAYNGSYYYPSSSPSGSTIYDITMTCPPWNPSSACSSTTGLSFAELYAPYALWFYDEGPAYQ